MRTIAFIACLLFKSVFLYSQVDSVYIIVEEQPDFRGSTYQFYKYVEENLVYPEYAHQNNISGRVFVQFTVDAANRVDQVQNVFVIKGVHPSLDYSAKTLVENMPNEWNPGKARGKVQPVTFVYPIVFDIEKVNPSRISNEYEDEIRRLLSLDSLTLDSLLYRKKITTNGN